MKKIVGFFITLLFTTIGFSVMAQSEQNALREVVERNTYGDNWFISLQGNANLLTAEQDGYFSMGDRLKFGGALSVGKWFNQNFGARIQITGGSLRGFNSYPYSSDGYFVHDNYNHELYPLGALNDTREALEANSDFKFKTNKDGKWGFWQDFNYGTATIDLMANFTNLFRGNYREHNLIDVIPFVGLGWIHAFNNNLTTPTYNHFVAKIGVRVNFNITDKWAIYLEPQASATDKEFDGYAGTAWGDGIVNLGLGVQYTFNKRFTSLTQIAQLTADEIDRLNKKINDNRYLIENHQDILERQQNLLDRLEKCCEENKQQVVTQQIVESACLPEYIRFGLDSYKLESSEQRKIAEVADYLKKNADSKILIVGYADKKTGNPPYNLKLSQKRVEVVSAELKRLGINSNRVFSEWKGDKEQPFPPNEWNRVVVMVERK